jgi:F-type H+-transporting ATPase subunit b
MLSLTHITYAADSSSSSGLGALGIDGKAFIIQLVTFLLAFWVLKRWAFGPIIKIMEQRRKTIEDGVALGEQMRKDKAALEAQVEKTIAKARTEADGIIAEADDMARQAIREAEEAAQQKAAIIVKEGEERASAEMVRARKKLENQIVGWVSDATEAIIGEKVDASKDAAIIDRVLKEQKTA